MIKIFVPLILLQKQQRKILVYFSISAYYTLVVVSWQLEVFLNEFQFFHQSVIYYQSKSCKTEKFRQTTTEFQRSEKKILTGKILTFILSETKSPSWVLSSSSISLCIRRSKTELYEDYWMCKLWGERCLRPSDCGCMMCPSRVDWLWALPFVLNRFFALSHNWAPGVRQSLDYLNIYCWKNWKLLIASAGNRDVYDFKIIF